MGGGKISPFRKIKFLQLQNLPFPFSERVFLFVFIIKKIKNAGVFLLFDIETEDFVCYNYQDIIIIGRI